MISKSKVHKNTMAVAAIWSEVPLDLIYLLARSPILDISDLVRFGAVCKSWRSVLNESQWFGYGPMLEALSVSPLHLPKLMLAETDASDDTRDFFDLATGRTFQLSLPEARARRVCGSNYGWVVTMGEDMEIHLLNPITRQRIRLPSQLSFDDFGLGITNDITHQLYASRQKLRNAFIEKAIIVRNPCCTGSCTVAAIVYPGGEGIRVVVVRPCLDKFWTVLTCGEHRHVSDIIHHKGLLYGITYGRFPRLYVWDMGNITHGSFQKMKRKRIPMPMPYHRRDLLRNAMFYLVEVFGELVGVGRIHSYGVDGQLWVDGTFYTSRVFVFRVENGRWVEVNDLGDCCLVLGGNTSTALSPVPSDLQRNCIYFTDNYSDYVNQGGLDMGVYSLDDGKYDSFYHGNLFQTFSPPIWLTLNPSKYNEDR